ncbi:LOW QUALITY PROTEIN: uncharacterized protein LOC144526109 [Sander vitreus]
MAEGALFVWIPFLLSCVFQASDNRHVCGDACDSNGGIKNPATDHIFSQIPITLPEGIDPKNINITSITIKTCTDVKEQLAQLNIQLQQTNLRNSHLDNEAFGLRREVRQLNLQLATCSATASAITGSYQIQLLNKLKQLLETFDSDTFLILKIIALTREVNTLQRKIKHAANATETSEIGVLQREQQEKINELNVKMQQVESSHPNSALILQIISLQNQIWDMEQVQLRRGETNLQPDKIILDLQGQLDRKLSELRAKGDADLAMLELISVHSKITVMQRLINVIIERSRVHAADYQRAWRQKAELLRKKILQLNREESNSELTKEILKLQAEVEHFRQLMMNAKKTTESQLKELRVILEEEKKQQANLQKHLEETEYAQSQLIMKFISIMKEMRELDDDEQHHTTSSQATKCSGLEEIYEVVKTEIEQKIVELTRTRNSKAALILNVINLHSDLKTLRDLISTESDPDRLSELQRQLEEKQEELNSKTADMERLIPNPKIILTIIDLQNEIWDLQKKAANDTTGDDVKDLQDRVKGLITELDDNGDDNTKLMMQIILLQSQVEQLERQLPTTQVTQHTDDLTTKKFELQKYVNELNEKNQTIARLILTITDLQNQLRNLEKGEHNKGQTASAPITKLREQLKAKVEEHIRDQAEIKALQNKLNQTEAQCTGFEDKLKDLENELEDIRNQIEEKTLVLDSSDTRINNLTAQIMELHKKIKPLEDEILDVKETSAENIRVMEIADLRTQLKKAQKKASKPAENSSELEQQLQTQQRVNKKLESANKELRKQLKAKVEEHIRDQAEIKALQNKLNQTEAQCTGFEDKLKDLQTNLDAKMQELQSKTESVSSLALQVSTLTLQLEELKRQLHNTDSETKIKELQKLIDEKNNELAKKTEELKARSAQPQRLLQIIAIQTEIEKISYVAANDTDYAKIRALQDHLNNLVDGIQDENNENTKLMFKMLAYQDEIARLEKQEKSQTQAALERIKDLENELEDIRNQIEEKTLVLDSSDTRINNLTAQIMELHKKIKPLEDEILDIKETSAENVRELQNRLELITRQLQDSELRLQEADAKNFNLIMEIADLRTQLKKAQKKASKPAENSSELEQQLQTQQRVNKKLESANKDLKEEVKELKMCCADDVTHCADLQRQLQQSQEDADRLQQQLRKKDANLKQLQQQLEEQIRENNDARLTTFSRFTGQVTLDPNTAHPRIALSADNTRISTSEEIQNVPYNPGRFDVVLAVLGTTGFSTGRHYWEVSVAGKLCYHLGMASESAQRKGSITFSPENGFWTLVMNKQSQLKAADSKPFIIPIQTQPLTLGILLDYKKGQISFYDAGARSHIYSFVGQRFTDKIYPFVNFCAGDVESLTPIVLLPSGSVDWIK